MGSTTLEQDCNISFSFCFWFVISDQGTVHSIYPQKNVHLQLHNKSSNNASNNRENSIHLHANRRMKIVSQFKDNHGCFGTFSFTFVRTFFVHFATIHETKIVFAICFNFTCTEIIDKISAFQLLRSLH